MKVLERPGDAAENRSEEVPVVPRPDSMKPKPHTDDVSADVPEKVQGKTKLHGKLCEAWSAWHTMLATVCCS